MTAVLQPLNEKAADIIVKHADLLQSAEMEPLLLQLVAHVFAYRVIIKRCITCKNMSILVCSKSSHFIWSRRVPTCLEVASASFRAP
jgi:hypothetical protein